MKRAQNIIKTAGIFAGICLFFLYRRAKNIEYGRAKREAEKYNSYYQNTAKWALRQSEKPAEKYFIQNGYKYIAIYGAKEMGELLRKELDGTNVVVAYYVDRNAEGVEAKGIDVYYPEEELPEVDAMVVTPFFYYDSIKRSLETKLKCPIIALSSILDKI